MKNRFYLACLRETVGGNMGFHRIDGQGYSTNIDLAETFTREEAQRKWDTGRIIELPVSADHIDALAVWRVDHQYIPYENTLVDGCTEYVAFRKGEWNGNDVYWLADILSSDDFSKARIFSNPDLSLPGIVWIPYSLAKENKRRTFDMANYNRRTMTQGSGLVKPAHIRRSERRKQHAKIRWNCPGCGKNSWQDNPYHFDGYKDVMCDEWRWGQFGYRKLLYVEVIF